MVGGGPDAEDGRIRPRPAQPPKQQDMGEPVAAAGAIRDDGADRVVIPLLRIDILDQVERRVENLAAAENVVESRPLDVDRPMHRETAAVLGGGRRVEVRLPRIEPSEIRDLPKAEIAWRRAETKRAAQLQDHAVLCSCRPIRSLIAEPSKNLDGHRAVSIDELDVDHALPAIALLGPGVLCSRESIRKPLIRWRPTATSRPPCRSARWP